ncbi:MAG: glycosyltransferase [Rickettsiales bacterium]
MKKILIVYHYVAHYRAGIFKELLDSDSSTINFEYHIAASSATNISSINVISPDSCAWLRNRWVELKNIWLLDKILWQKGLVAEVISGKYDVYIFLGNVYFISTWVSIIIAKFQKKPVYLWTHGLLRDEGGVKWQLRKIFYSLADGLLLYGNRAKQILINKGISEGKLHVIYNSLDYNNQIQLLKNIDNPDIDIPKNSKYIVVSCRLTKEKKVELAIQAMKILVRYAPCLLVIIGDGDESANLKKLALDLGVAEYVKFFGACYDERKMANIISNASVSVIPGDIGLSAIHSLTYGTPVVTHNNLSRHKPEVEAIIDQVSGSFYDEGSIESLAQKLQSWLTKDDVNVSDACKRIISDRFTPGRQRFYIEEAIRQ